MPRVCRYLHVPLQAGSDDVLDAMHRPYDIEEYVDSVTRAKDALPGLALATDIIVGFPGETDEAFESTLDVVSEVEFSKLHVFRYSPRPDTPAAEMADADPGRDEEGKIQATDRPRQRDALGFLESHMNGPLEVLVEDRARGGRGDGVAPGQTDDYVRVWFEGDACCWVRWFRSSGKKKRQPTASAEGRCPDDDGEGRR